MRMIIIIITGTIIISKRNRTTTLAHGLISNQNIPQSIKRGKYHHLQVPDCVSPPRRRRRDGRYLIIGALTVLCPISVRLLISFPTPLSPLSSSNSRLSDPFIITRVKRGQHPIDNELQMEAISI